MPPALKVFASGFLLKWLRLSPRLWQHCLRAAPKALLACGVALEELLAATRV